MLKSLKRHPDSRGGEAVQVAVEIARPRTSLLTLRYRVTGAVDGLRLPPPARPERTDELWRRTCFEAFVQGRDGRYFEFNFAPSTQWAAYSFDGYRSGMAPAEVVPEIEPHIDGECVALRVALDLTPLGLAGAEAWRLGVSTVLEDSAGGISYWALAHPAGKPDFHHLDGFACDLPMTDPQ